jgi:hypothetical protein
MKRNGTIFELTVTGSAISIAGTAAENVAGNIFEFHCSFGGVQMLTGSSFFRKLCAK